MNTHELLQKSPLFAGFSSREIESVTESAKERSFALGDKIIEEGEIGLGFYLLLEGSAQARKGDTKLADFAPGDYFGEMALLLENTPRTADVVATAPSRCLVITQWDLRAIMKVHPDISHKIMAELAKRLRNTDAALSD